MTPAQRLGAFLVVVGVALLVGFALGQVRP